MYLKKLLIGASVSLLLSSNVLANSFGVPERPTNTSPSSMASDVSITPTLTISEFVVENDNGDLQLDTVLTETEWLVYESTGVT